MDAFNKHQSTSEKPNYIPPANFTALQNFLSAAATKHREEFGRFYLEDPTTVGFSLWFNPKSPLFNTNNELGESAFNYLVYSGETVRAEKLYKFILQLRALTEKFPHFFLTLSGLGNLYEMKPGESVHSKELEITTNESMDFRIASLVENYMHATYDFEYRRRTVPINLIEFDMKIFISEIRSFRTFVGRAAEGVDADGFRVLNDNLGLYVIDMERCMFDFGASNPFLETINNSQPEIAENSFKIISGNTHFHHNKVDVFDIFDVRQPENEVSPMLIAEGKKQTRLQKLGNDLKSKVVSTLTDNADLLKDEINKTKDRLTTDYNPANVAGQMLNRYFTDVVDSKFKQAILGNVFFTEQIPSGATLADDLINGRNPNLGGVVQGRTGDPRKMMSEAILGYDSIQVNTERQRSDAIAERERILSVDNIDTRNLETKKDALFRTLTEIFDNADKLTPEQIETVLSHFAKSNLGNVFTNGNNIS